MSKNDYEVDFSAGDNGADAETEPLNKEAEASAEAVKSSAETESDDGGSWEFEASAPSLNADFLQSAGNAEVEVKQPVKQYEAPKPSKADYESKPASKDIVIKREKITAALLSIIAVLVIAVIVVLGVRYYTVPNSNEKMNPGNIAVTIGDTDISVGLYNYYYDSIVYEYTSYAVYGYYDLDTTKDFSTQYTVDEDGNEISWQDYFKKLAIDRLKNNTYYYEKGLKAGTTLTDTQKEQIETQLDSIKDSAASAGSGVNEYINENFGDYCGLETLRKFLEQYFIAGNYYYQSQIENRPGEDEVNAYFEENEDTYMSCSYAVIEMDYDLTDETTMAKSVENAEYYASMITDLDSMKEIMPEASSSLIQQFVAAGYFTSEEEAITTLTDSIEATQSRADIEGFLGADIAEWIFDESTEVNSINYYANENNGIVYIVLKTAQPFLDDSEVYSVRHILIIPGDDEETSSTDEEATYTDEQWAQALKDAQAIVDKYNQGEKTELAFAQLAETESEDTESTSSGSSGLYGGGYEGTHLGEMVPEFEGWAMDPSRKYGDVDIVKSDYGYHIMYFIYAGPEYYYNAQTDYIIERDTQEMEKITVNENAGMKKAHTAKPGDPMVYSASSGY